MAVVNVSRSPTSTVWTLALLGESSTGELFTRDTSPTILCSNLVTHAEAVSGMESWQGSKVGGSTRERV